jgi:hypothetical protein
MKYKLSMHNFHCSNCETTCFGYVKQPSSGYILKSLVIGGGERSKSRSGRFTLGGKNPWTHWIREKSGALAGIWTMDRDSMTKMCRHIPVLLKSDKSSRHCTCSATCARILSIGRMPEEHSSCATFFFRCRSGFQNN